MYHRFYWCEKQTFRIKINDKQKEPKAEAKLDDLLMVSGTLVVFFFVVFVFILCWNQTGLYGYCCH